MDQKQINDLLTKMTLEEKISQLLQLTANLHEGTEDQSQITGPMEEMGITGEMVRASGSVLGLSGAASIIALQQDYMKKPSRDTALVHGGCSPRL